MLSRGMSKTEVQNLLGKPASTSMNATGQEGWEYREYRWSFTQKQRELVAGYSVEFDGDKVVAWQRTAGATFRPGVQRTTVITK